MQDGKDSMSDLKIEIELVMSNEMNIAERKRYNWWDALGDIGGFHDGLVLLVRFFLAPYSAAMFNHHLV